MSTLHKFSTSSCRELSCLIKGTEQCPLEDLKETDVNAKDALLNCSFGAEDTLLIAVLLW